MAEPISTQVVIVRAGVAGMLVAYRLAQAGVQVVVLEAGPPVNWAVRVPATYRTAVIKVPEAPYPDTPNAPRPTVADLEGYYVQDGPTLFKSTWMRRGRRHRTWYFAGH